MSDMMNRERGENMTENFGPILVITFLLIFVLYFIPTLIAILNKKKSKAAIIILNVLTGWSFIGWIIALIWALTKDEKI